MYGSPNFLLLSPWSKFSHLVPDSTSLGASLTDSTCKFGEFGRLDRRLHQAASVRVVPEIDIFASSTGVFYIFTLRNFPAALTLGAPAALSITRKTQSHIL